MIDEKDLEQAYKKGFSLGSNLHYIDSVKKATPAYDMGEDEVRIATMLVEAQKEFNGARSDEEGKAVVEGVVRGLLSILPHESFRRRLVIEREETYAGSWLLGCGFVMAGCLVGKTVNHYGVASEYSAAFAPVVVMDCPEIFEEMLAAGMPRDERDGRGYTVAHGLACVSEWTEGHRKLSKTLKIGDFVNENQGYRPGEIAASYGNKEAAVFLLKADPIVRTEDYFEKTMEKAKKWRNGKGELLIEALQEVRAFLEYEDFQRAAGEALKTTKRKI